MILVLVLILEITLIGAQVSRNVFNEITFKEFSTEEYSQYFTPLQVESLSSSHYPKQCVGLDQYCCVSKSLLGHCNPNSINYNQVPVANSPIREFDYIVNQHLNGSRILAFLGDSMSHNTGWSVYCSLKSSGFVTAFDEVINRHTDWRVQGTHTLITNPPDQSLSNPSTIHYIRMDKPSVSLQNFTNAIRENDVLVFNFGVHYLQYQTQVYARDMESAFEIAAREYSPEKVLIWRETSAQAAYSVGGEFNGRYSPLLNISKEVFRTNHKNCYSGELVFDEKTPKQWRDAIVKNAAVQAGFVIIELDDPDILEKRSSTSPVLYWMPFFDYSDSRKHLHPQKSNGRMCDPTHFCYTPHFWSPFFENLARILDIAYQ